MNERLRPYILLFAIVLAPVFRALSYDMAAYVLLPTRMDSLFTGVFMHALLGLMFTGLLILVLTSKESSRLNEILSISVFSFLAKYPTCCI